MLTGMLSYFTTTELRFFKKQRSVYETASALVVKLVNNFVVNHLETKNLELETGGWSVTPLHSCHSQHF